MGWVEKLAKLKDLRSDLSRYSRWIDLNIKDAMTLSLGLELPTEMNHAVFHLEQALSLIEKTMKDDKPDEVP